MTSDSLSEKNEYGSFIFKYTEKKLNIYFIPNGKIAFNKAKAKLGVEVHTVVLALRS
jgi:hypothetical protein